MLKYYDYISIAGFIFILIIYIFSVIHTLFIKKHKKKVSFQIKKLGIWELIIIILYISGLIRVMCYTNNAKTSIIYILLISIVIGFVATYLFNKFSKEKIDEAAYGINIEQMKAYVYTILQKYNLEYREVNNDSDWLKDIRVKYEKKEAKIELHRNGESITLIFIRGLDILPFHDAIITDLKNIISVNAKETRWKDNLRQLVLETLIVGYLLLSIGSTFFYKIIG